MSDFKESLEHNTVAVAKTLDGLLPITGTPESRLVEAMRYATLDGGKRVRPFLVMSSARLFNVDDRRALRVAAAVEMVHCYSLTHDDLPAMDDDALRRGKPACHIKFDEATAILAGDALLTKAFGVLGDAATHPDSGVRSDLVVELARAAGDEGMVGGQVLDMLAENNALGVPEITRLQRLKTGMLIGFACESGAILGKATKGARQALRGYAHDLGLAFQIVDDLLDVEGSAEELGKRTGKDEEAGKATFVSLLGVERARAQADLLGQQAAQHLELFAEKAEPLRQLARFVVNRRA